MTPFQVTKSVNAAWPPLILSILTISSAGFQALVRSIKASLQ
jgi:hypothetical protein